MIEDFRNRLQQCIANGGHHRAEICEMVGLFLLHHFSQFIGKNNIGLYRDKGLAIFDNAFNSSLECTRKRSIALFKDHSLKVTTKCNLMKTDFFDVNPKSKKYWSFHKSNDQPLYIPMQSNHPPFIKKKTTAIQCSL